MGAKITMGNRPLTTEDLHEVTDVFMNAIHHSFQGRVLDGRAVAGALLASAVGVLRDLQVESPKDVAKAFIDGIDLGQIRSFTPPMQ